MKSNISVSSEKALHMHATLPMWYHVYIVKLCCRQSVYFL